MDDGPTAADEDDEERRRAKEDQPMLSTLIGKRGRKQRTRLLQTDKHGAQGTDLKSTTSLND